MGETNHYTDEEKLRRDKTGIRIKELIKERQTTIVALAKLLDGIAESSLRNYIKGRQPLPERVARALERLSGKIAPYWMGQTDCQTWADYEAELEEIEFAAICEYEDLFLKERAERTTFFSMLGYRYEDRERTAAYDFEQFAPGGSKHPGEPHILTNLRDSKQQPAYFTTQELTNLINELQDMVSVKCYQKIRKEGVDNGNT